MSAKLLPLQNLIGTAPASLSRLPALELLDLSSNGMSGLIPEFASRKLEFVSLADNQLIGEVGAA